MFIDKIKKIAIDAVEDKIDHNKLQHLLRMLIQPKILEAFENREKSSSIEFTKHSMNIYEMKAIEQYLHSSGFNTELIDKIHHRNGHQIEAYKLIITFKGEMRG